MDEELKSFLGMTSNYRKFIRDYARVAKPLTTITRGEFSKVKSNQSKRVPIKLNEEALQAFSDLKSILSSSEVLAFPNFNKPFHLTTDASIYASGAVLSQEEQGRDKPIAFISRSLNKTEENYATNEKEMLAIVWALDNLRSYLYGAGCIKNSGTLGSKKIIAPWFINQVSRIWSQTHFRVSLRELIT